MKQVKRNDPNSQTSESDSVFTLKCSRSPNVSIKISPVFEFINTSSGLKHLAKPFCCAYSIREMSLKAKSLPNLSEIGPTLRIKSKKDNT